MAQREARASRAMRMIQGQPIWLSCLFIFICSFILRTSLVCLTGQYRRPEFPEPATIAQSIVQTGVFGNPYKVPTGATAHAAPFLPFLLSEVFRLVGTGAAAGLIEALLSITACSLQYALLPLTAQLLGWPARVGTVAGLFGALFPFRFWLETKGTFEHTYAGLALLVTTIMTLAVWHSCRFTLASGIARGAVWALALHISASLLSVFLLLLVIETMIIQSTKVAPRVAYLATVCGTVFVLLVPWTARNYAQFGKLFYIRDNLGLELSVSNRDDASPLIDQNMGNLSYRHPNGSVAEALKVKQTGEIAYNKERMQEAKIWIRNHPATFLQLTLERVWYFWFPMMQRPWQRTTYSLVTVLGLLGVLIAVQRWQRAALILLPIWLAYPLIYYLIESSTRYRYPMDWTVLLMASYAVCSWSWWERPLCRYRLLKTEILCMENLRKMRIPALLCAVVLTVFGYGIVRPRREVNRGPTPFNTGAVSQLESRSSPGDKADAALRKFRARCETPGVIACVDFDDERWFKQGAYVYPAADGVYRATKDTTVKYSGTSSLRFEYPGRTPANGAGVWTMQFGKEFAENASFYVQYRMRLNDVMAKTDWDKVVSSSWKQSIFHHTGATCANIELTTGRYGWNGANGFPVMYTECGGKGMVTNQSNPPYKIQQGGYNCWYGQFNSSDCFFYRANEWMIFYYRVSIGTWGKPNSVIQAWVGLDGQKLKKWVDLSNFVLNKDSDSSSYDSVTLLPYMAQKNMKAEHPTGYMWFDELIVSSEPIPDPAERTK